MHVPGDKLLYAHTLLSRFGLAQQRRSANVGGQIHRPLAFTIDEPVVEGLIK